MTIEELLINAKEHKASDVHITVGLPPKMRVNGILIDMDYPGLLPADTAEIIGSIMDARSMKQLEELGEVEFSYSIPREGRYRVNVFHQRGSMAAAIRLVPESIPLPEELGIPDSVIDLYRKKRGLILVTGPAGSGKSTTLASIIDKINSSVEAHIITLEAPIEYMHKHKKAMVNQREVGIDTGSYPNAIRAAMREDADVIMIGEMSDPDTISTAITAAEKGHLVLSTLHTIGAASTIERIVDVFPAHHQQQIRIQLSMVLEAVISQQLIPTADRKRRVAAFEVMHSTPAVKNLIREAKTSEINSTIQNGRNVGMQTMDDAIYDLYMKGEINRENADIYAQDSNYIEKRIESTF